MIPYGRHLVDEDDISSVVDVLRSDWLTTGPVVQKFERRLSDFVGAQHGVAVSNGTAALICAMYAINIGPGDEVIVSPMTFVASANCIVAQGATPIFADVDQKTLLVDSSAIEKKITKRTKAVIAVDYAGHPVDYDAIRAIAEKRGLYFISDASHALGAHYKDKPVGSLSDLTVFSFHPVKHITTGEGGMITTNSLDLAKRMRLFRNHGITSDHYQREKESSWFYEMVDIGYNYRLTDIQCALGLTQLQKIQKFLKRRHEIAAQYDAAFASVPEITPLATRTYAYHAYHLYVVKIDFEAIGINRKLVFKELRQKGIGINVHYIPVHLQPFYRENFKTRPGLCPAAEAAYEQIISLPMFPGLSDGELEKVIQTLINLI